MACGPLSSQPHLFLCSERPPQAAGFYIEQDGELHDSQSKPEADVWKHLVLISKQAKPFLLFPDRVLPATCVGLQF